MDIKVNEEALEDTLGKVESMRNWSPRVISKLENSIRSANEEELFRVNPLAWAAQKNVDEFEAVDLFLHAAKAGLFYMEWNIVCPCCGKISQSLRDLHGLQSENSCKVCFRKDRATLDDYVQVTFTVSPPIRELRFHHPETLSLEEYCFKYLYEPSAKMAGMTVNQALQMFQRHFSMFSPGEKITVETEVESGILSCVDVFNMQSFGLRASGERMQETQKIAVKLIEGGFDLPLPQMKPGEFQVGSRNYAGTVYPIRPGKVEVEFEQCVSAKTALLVMYFPVDGLPAEIPFPAGVDLKSLTNAQSALDTQFSSPRLTAKRLFTCQTFHDLFRAEVFNESEGFGVKDVTILFTDLKSSTQLYQQIGDLNAYALVREHYGILNKAVVDQHGAVVKTIGDAIMAAFTEPVDAVGAGLEMLRNLRPLNKDSHYGELILKIGIHRGAAISVTLNEQIDYFGGTVNIASRVQGSAGGNEIYLTEEIYNGAGVQDLLQKVGCKVETILIPLRCIEEEVKIFRVTGAN
jgi:class 3 adenylate cyclase